MAEDRQSLSAEIMAVKLEAEGRSSKLRRRMKRILRMSRAYRAVFFDDDGRLTADARLVLEDLLDVSDFARAPNDLDAQALAEHAGRRRVVMHLFGRFRLPESQLAQIERDLQRLTEDETR